MSNMIQAARAQVAQLTQQAYEKAAQAGLLPEGAQVKATIEIPKDTANGDFTTTFALAASKALRQPPRNIAQALLDHMDLAGSYFASAEIAGPGFLNFRLNDSWYAAVCEAVEFFGNVCGLAHKDIVVSTVGDHRLFDRLPALSVRPALALSLHTTDNALRRKLLTNSKDIPVETLLERTLDYADETGYPAQIEWTLMAGVNDAPEQVERLADLIEGRYAMVNFIAVNPVEGSGFRRPESAHMQDLITILRRRGTVATLRDSAAQDIEGGCGQLRARVIGIRKEQA